MMKRRKKHAGTVYAMTNSENENAVAAFKRAEDGSLQLMHLYNTCGKGTGPRGICAAIPGSAADPLMSQGSLVRFGNRLFAVNTASNSVSSFCICCDGSLELVDVESSGGCQPTSIAVCGHVLYVANTGCPPRNIGSNVTGFRICSDGHLVCIPGSMRGLSSPNAQPCQVAFSPDGRYLAVSELSTDRIGVFRVKPDWTLSRAAFNQANAEGPSGMHFQPSGLMLSANAENSSLSAYTIAPDLSLHRISAPVPNGQSGTRRVAVSGDRKYAYTSNTKSGTISVYSISPNGKTEYRYSIPATQQQNGSPTDIAVAGDNLYALNGNRGTISVFDIDPRGVLEMQQLFMDTCLPRLGAQGLAVR